MGRPARRGNGHFHTIVVWYCPRIVNRIECGSRLTRRVLRRETYDTFRNRERHVDEKVCLTANLAVYSLSRWGRHTRESRLPVGDKGTDFTNCHVSARRAGCTETCLSGSTEAHRSNLVVRLQRSNTDVRSDNPCVGLLEAGTRTWATWTDLERFPTFIMLESSRPFWIKAGAPTANAADGKSRPGGSS
jgi:hypothetical protein